METNNILTEEAVEEKGKSSTSQVQSQKKQTMIKKNKKDNKIGYKDNYGKDEDGNKKINFKLIIILFIDILCLILLFVLLYQLPQKANQLKSLISSSIQADESSKFSTTDVDIKNNKERIDKIIALFSNEVGVVNFIKEVEILRKEGIVTNFTFAHSEPVRDRTKALGIPVVIEFKGTWQQLDNGIQRIQKLPYLFRAISITVNNAEEPGVIETKYGGFLYVNEEF